METHKNYNDYEKSVFLPYGNDWWASLDSHYPNHTNWLSVKMNIEDYREF